MTIHLRGLPNEWDEWRPSKLNLYEDGDSDGGGPGGDTTGGDTTGGDPSGGAFDGPGAADGFGQGWGDAATSGPGTTGGNFDSTTDASGMFGDLGPAGTLGNEGTLGDTFGSQGQSLGDTFGDLGPAGTFGTEGTIGGTFGSEGQDFSDTSFGMGPSFTDQTFSDLGPSFTDTSGFGFSGKGSFTNDPNDPTGATYVADLVGPNQNTFADPYGDFRGPNDPGNFLGNTFTSPMDPNDPTGSTISNTDFFGNTFTGPMDPNDPTGSTLSTQDFFGNSTAQTNPYGLNDMGIAPNTGPASLASQLGIQDIAIGKGPEWGQPSYATGILGMNQGTLTQPDVPTTTFMIDPTTPPPPQEPPAPTPPTIEMPQFEVTAPAPPAPPAPAPAPSPTVNVAPEQTAPTSQPSAPGMAPSVSGTAPGAPGTAAPGAPGTPGTPDMSSGAPSPNAPPPDASPPGGFAPDPRGIVTAMQAIVNPTNSPLANTAPAQAPGWMPSLLTAINPLAPAQARGGRGRSGTGRGAGTTPGVQQERGIGPQQPSGPTAKQAGLTPRFDPGNNNWQDLDARFVDRLNRAYDAMNDKEKASFKISVDPWKNNAFRPVTAGEAEQRGMPPSSSQYDTAARGRAAGFPAAPPGGSIHGLGRAVDVQRGPARDFLEARGKEFGLTGIMGGVKGRDPPHVQMIEGQGPIKGPEFVALPLAKPKDVNIAGDPGGLQDQTPGGRGIEVVVDPPDPSIPSIPSIPAPALEVRDAPVLLDQLGKLTAQENAPPATPENILGLPIAPEEPQTAPESKGDVVGKEVQTDLVGKGVPAPVAKAISDLIKEATDVKGAPLNARDVQDILEAKGITNPAVVEIVKDAVETTQAPGKTTAPEVMAPPPAPFTPGVGRPGQTTAAPAGLAGPPHAAPFAPNVQMGRSAQEALGRGFLGPLYDMIVGNKGSGPAIGPPLDLSAPAFVGPTPASGRFGLNDMGLPNEPGIVQQAPYLPSGDPGGLQGAVPGSRGLDLTGDPGGLQDAPARGAEPIVDVPAPPIVEPIVVPPITVEAPAPTEPEGPFVGKEAPLETPGVLGVIAEALELDSGEIRMVKDLSRATGIPIETILAMAKRLADDTGVSIDMALQIIAQPQSQMDEVGYEYG